MPGEASWVVLVKHSYPDTIVPQECGEKPFTNWLDRMGLSELNHRQICEVLDIWTYPEGTLSLKLSHPTASLGVLCFLCPVVLCVALAFCIYVSYFELPLCGSRARSVCPAWS